MNTAQACRRKPRFACQMQNQNLSNFVKFWYWEIFEYLLFRHTVLIKDCGKWSQVLKGSKILLWSSIFKSFFNFNLFGTKCYVQKEYLTNNFNVVKNWSHLMAGKKSNLTTCDVALRNSISLTSTSVGLSWNVSLGFLTKKHCGLHCWK